MKPVGGRRQCSPRRNSWAAAAATRRLECLGPKIPHQSYAQEDGADTKGVLRVDEIQVSAAHRVLRLLQDMLLRHEFGEIQD